MRYIIQAIFALAVLFGLPVFLDTPATTEGEIAASVAALILVGVAIHGALGYVRSRKPASYHDSMMPPIESRGEKTPKA